MKRRCYNPNEVSYKNYGGRGIVVCDRIKSSVNEFVALVGLPGNGESIDSQ